MMAGAVHAHPDRLTRTKTQPPGARSVVPGSMSMRSPNAKRARQDNIVLILLWSALRARWVAWQISTAQAA